MAREPHDVHGVVGLSIGIVAEFADDAGSTVDCTSSTVTGVQGDRDSESGSLTTRCPTTRQLWQPKALRSLPL